MPNTNTDSAATKMLLVRHGHVEGIAPERFRGRRDLPLTPLGERQADATAARIHAHWRPSAVYTSPLVRSRATAHRIADRFGLDVRVVEELVDIDYGAWHGMTVEEAHARWPIEVERWKSVPHRARIPDGESLQDVLARVSRLAVRLREEHRGETIVLVGHDCVNRAFLLHALDLALTGYWRLGQSPCAINEIDAFAGGYVLQSMNATSHLEGII